MSAAVWISVLSQHDLGQLARASFPAPGEDFLRALVTEPEAVVSRLIGTTRDEWLEVQVALVAELAAAPDDKARGAVKRRLPALVPAKFRGERRTIAECEERQVIGHDFDAVVADTFDAAAALIQAALPDRFLAIHTTATERNADGTWRLRAFELLDRAASPDEWERRVKAHMRSIGEHDSQALDVARLLYLPLRTAGYRFAIFEGARTRLDELAADAAPPPAAAPVASGPAPAPDARRAAAAQLLGAQWPAHGRHAAQLALAGALRRDGWAPEVALDFLCDVCRIAGDEDPDKRMQTIAHTWSTNANVTGWRELERHVDAAVVSAARGLVDQDGDAKRELAALAAAPSLAPSIREAVAAALPASAVIGSPGDNPLNVTWGKWSEAPPPIDFVVDGLIPKAAIAMVYGSYDTCKTWLSLSLLKSVSLGELWLGRFATKAQRVCFIDLESGTYNTRRRLYMLRVGDNPNLGAASYTDLKPSDPKFWIALAKYDCGVVVIDSLRVANGDADENDSAEAILPLMLAAQFSEATGCAVVWIHHANKSATDGWPVYRGSSGIMDQVDCAFAVRRPEKNSGRIEVKCVKPGDMRPPEDFALDVSFDDNERLAIVRLAGETSPADAEAAAGARELTDVAIQGAIRLALARGSVASKNKIQAIVGAKRQRCLVELDEMVKRGEVVEIPSTGGYQLDDDHRRLARVLDQVRAYEHWRSATKLAAASYVPTELVEKLVRDGVIVPRVTGGGESGGFVLVERPTGGPLP